MSSPAQCMAVTALLDQCPVMRLISGKLERINIKNISAVRLFYAHCHACPSYFRRKITGMGFDEAWQPLCVSPLIILVNT